MVTEAGFGSDLGAEKFLDIKCASSGLAPKLVVIVATIRALKYHGGVALADLSQSNPTAVKDGLPNLEKHIENMKKYNLTPIVAINHFYNDSDEEIEVVKNRCKELGVEVAVAKVHSQGGDGAIELAKKVVKIADEASNNFAPLYDWKLPIEEKILKIAQEIYGAKNVEYTADAKKDLRRIDTLGLSEVPVCIAKTQYSLSDDLKLLGRPENFTVTVRQIEIAAGAGFVVPIMGTIMRMPGLPESPAAERIDINDDGVISGLF